MLARKLKEDQGNFKITRIRQNDAHFSEVTRRWRLLPSFANLCYHHRSVGMEPRSLESGDPTSGRARFRDQENAWS